MNNYQTLKEKNEIFHHNMEKLYPTYDFSKSNYVNSNTKVDYFCENKEHGRQSALPANILKYGCSLCNKEEKRIIKANQFFSEMKKINPTYDFSKSNYVNSKTKIDYFCGNKEHGVKTAIPETLLKGHGCSACVGLCSSTAEKHFWEYVNEYFPAYDFSKFKYINSNTESTYHCGNKSHGIRKGTPNALIGNHGCGLCGIKKRVGEFTKTHEEFIQDLHKINPIVTENHIIGKYKTTQTKIHCKCPTCGDDWFPRPAYLTGSKISTGCRACNGYGYRELEIFYMVRDYFDGLAILSRKRYEFIDYLEYDITLILKNGVFVAIEYDGHHHFKECTYGSTKSNPAEKLIIQQKNDKKKNRLSLMHGVHLFRIHHEDYEKNPEDIITELFHNIEELELNPDIGGSIRFSESYNLNDRY